VVSGGGSGNALEDIMKTPLVRCDAPAWTLFGISLAGYNFLISTAGGLAVLGLLAKDRRA
jgi:disulfide bond formation protein DsbB